MGYSVLDFRRRRASGFGGVTTDFVWTVATTGSDETFTIPCQNVGVFNATVDWGDGSTSAITAYNDADLAHTYASAGDHQIRISGTLPNIYFNNAGDKLKVKSVENLGVVGWSMLDQAFRGCSNMTSFLAGNTDTSGVSDLRAFLRDCSALTTANVSGMETPLVTDMAQMLYQNTGLTDVIGLDGFSLAGLDATGNLNVFATRVTIPTARYDALLISWDAQNPFDGMSPDFGSSTYTGGGTAAAARANLISTDGWTITDGGTA